MTDLGEMTVALKTQDIGTVSSISIFAYRDVYSF
jgi:hypothetical protein